MAISRDCSSVATAPVLTLFTTLLCVQVLRLYLTRSKCWVLFSLSHTS
ncbi:hypothetical protein Ahy_A05g025005 isoform B [Arachis hypogaea]|uniref:Uncharacterized protein n=1 Tax=Arachis hypogaea TaxID=3818 RepID=A0A445D870_ARAHY|nr:hypothetical protein Ahy_A05g025005 isoform B [Arachis hypogaea]